MNPTTLKQKTEVITTVDGAQITVRRMYHKPARAFLKLLAGIIRGHAVELVSRDASGQVRLAPFEKILERLPELVAQADELAEFLVANSQDAPEAVDKLDFPGWAEVLAAALRLNCGPDLKNSFASIASALAPMLAETKTSTGAALTPSSSTPATTPAT